MGLYIHVLRTLPLNNPEFSCTKKTAMDPSGVNREGGEYGFDSYSKGASDTPTGCPQEREFPKGFAVPRSLLFPSLNKTDYRGFLHERIRGEARETAWGKCLRLMQVQGDIANQIN